MTKVKKDTVKSVTTRFMAWRNTAHGYINDLRYPVCRKIAEVQAADPQGRLNGLTVVELLAMINMAKGTNEHVYLSEEGNKTVGIWAAKNKPGMPNELRGA